MAQAQFRRKLARCLALGTLAIAPASFANGRFPRAQRLLEDPRDPDHLVLTATYGLVTTHDRGRHWFHICDASFSLTDDSYQGDALVSFSKSGALLAGVQWSITVSHDQGCQWSPALQERGAFVPDYTNSARAPFAILAAFARVTDGGLTNELVESTDDTTTWHTLGARLPVTTIDTVDIDPQDDQHIYATGRGEAGGQLLVSRDHGATWSVRPIPNTGADEVAYLAAIDPRDPKRVFVRTDAWVDQQTANDALLVSDDEGVTWRELFRSPAKLYGFALSPDGTRVLIGYGNPQEGGGRMVPGPWGLFLSETTQFSFECIYPGRVNCVTWTPTGIYVCTAQAFDGFELAFAPPEDLAPGLCLSPLLRRTEIQGPLACASGTTEARCLAGWDLTCRNIGACVDADTPSLPASSCTTDASFRDAAPTPSDASVQQDAATQQEKDADTGRNSPPSPTGCACRSTPSSSRPTSRAPLGALLVFALWLFRRRRPPVSGRPPPLTK